MNLSTSICPRMHRVFGTVRFPALGLAALMLASTGIQPLSAELPMLTEKPWLGYFAAIKTRNYQFGISSKGGLNFSPIDKDGEKSGAYLSIPMVIGLEERLPNGKTRMLDILPESLESSDPATDQLKKVVFRGQVTGGATFEATIEQSRDIVSIGGRVTDPGPTTNPLAFSVITRIPYFSGHMKKDTPAQLKAFEERIKNDYIEVKFSDRKQCKKKLFDTVDASSPEMNGPGIVSAELGLYPFKNRKFYLSASANSIMKLENSRSAKGKSGAMGAPLYEGVVFSWSADPAKDPRGEARISYIVK